MTSNGKYSLFLLIHLSYLCTVLYIYVYFTDDMHKILIVDDEKFARVFISELVTSYMPDSIVKQMENPHHALACMQKEHFDLLFVDIRMPGMSGLELMEAIHRTGKFPYTVIISSYCKFDYAVKGMELGAVRFITKPFHEEKIYEAIQSYLSKIKTETIDLKAHDGSHRIKIDRLLAIQRINRRKVKVYTTDAFFPDVTSSFSQMYSLLPAHFHHIQRDCICNYRAVKYYNLKAREIIMDSQNKKVAFIASREKIKEFDAWFRFNAENMGAVIARRNDEANQSHHCEE